MELGPQNHNGDDFLECNSIIVVYMDPLGKVYWKVWVSTWNFRVSSHCVTAADSQHPLVARRQRAAVGEAVTMGALMIRRGFWAHL